MLKNWYLATFAILLTVVGVGFVPFSVPNQEIVVQFNDGVSLKDTAVAITQVKKQLVSIGAEDVQITARDDGSLKITYFSNVAVSSIQEIVSSELGLLGNTSQNNTDLPFNQALDFFELTVSEIGGGTDIHNGLKGHVLDIETKSSRFYPPEFFFTTSGSARKNKELRVAEISVLIDSQQISFIDYDSRLFPETRAGPIA